MEHPSVLLPIVYNVAEIYFKADTPLHNYTFMLLLKVDYANFGIGW